MTRIVSCSPASIPQELKDEKALLTEYPWCEDDYIPTGNLIGYNILTPPPASYLEPDGIWLLDDAIPESFDMTLTVDEDEYKLWKSEIFTTPDNTDTANTVNVGIDYGVGDRCWNAFPINNSPYSGTVVSEDTSYWNGEVFNTGWFGRSIQFFFTLQRIYCCEVDDNDEVVDYTVRLWYELKQFIDGVHTGDRDCDYANFCSPSDFQTSGYGTELYAQVRNY